MAEYQYWLTERKRMSDQLAVQSNEKGQCHIFQTVSAADIHWGSFHRLLSHAKVDKTISITTYDSIILCQNKKEQ